MCRSRPTMSTPVESTWGLKPLHLAASLDHSSSPLPPWSHLKHPSSNTGNRRQHPLPLLHSPLPPFPISNSNKMPSTCHSAPICICIVLVTIVGPYTSEVCRHELRSLSHHGSNDKASPQNPTHLQQQLTQELAQGIEAPTSKLLATWVYLPPPLSPKLSEMLNISSPNQQQTMVSTHLQADWQL